MAKVEGQLWIAFEDMDIEISPETIDKLFKDKQILMRLVELELEENKKALASMESFVREVFEEEKKYRFDVDKYPRELIEKIREVDELDEEIFELKESIKRLETLLRKLKERDGSG